MAATVDSFRAAFPAFRNPLSYPDSQIAFYLAIAVRLHAPDRWGDLLDYGVQLWTAHALSMDGAAVAAGGTPGAVRGTVTSMSADGVSWTRDISSAVDPQAGHWNLSTFGLRWRDLQRMMGAGPLLVGAPSLYDAYLAGAGWLWPGPGVDVTW